ncbi:MAG: AbrB/MazE/SpoVT family DNA-binding domain-containing protein [Bryobacterales bacterium]|nr:AbrB/MazE/SpoVT family DNA-binding domain-containing protein [Bryobacterales bacterium]
MRVSRWGNSLGVRLPQKLVRSLGLKPGDQLEVVAATPLRIVVAKAESRAQAIERMRARAWPIPEDCSFDRDEGNTR